MIRLQLLFTLHRCSSNLILTIFIFYHGKYVKYLYNILNYEHKLKKFSYYYNHF